MTNPILRDALPDDAAAILALNNACAPAVSASTLEQVRWYLDECPYFRVVVSPDPEPEIEAPVGVSLDPRPDTGLIGFLNAMSPDVEYESGNFLWFRERYLEDFLYIDRVAVDAAHQRRGIGQHLYRNVERYALEQGFARLACEVNVRPRNEPSLAFHQRMGFRTLEERETEYGPRVIMLEKELYPDD